MQKQKISKSVLIYSGGVDSTTLLYYYKSNIKIAVSFDYGSKHNKKEITFAKYHCNKLGIKHIIIQLPFINKYFESNLLQSGNDIPEERYKNSNMESTVVPFRNGIMISICVGICSSNNYNNILIANHSGDHAIYPDCRKSFINRMNKAINNGTYHNIKLMAPFNDISKRDITLIGKKLEIDYSKTWSCYKGNKFHCGKCGTCIERKEALTGFDNTKYLQ